MLPAWFSWKTALAVAIALAVVAVPGALLVAWLGLYNIAASHGHPAWLNSFLELGMRRSVAVNAEPMPHPELDDPGLIALGAAHYQGGCFPCHAAPGHPINPVFLGMLPSPPRLETHAPTWKIEELHWIVQHGLQYAGMPGWSGRNRPDEVWAVVAFLQRLPALDPTEYQRLAAGNSGLSEGSLQQIIEEGLPALTRTACDRCHDTADRPPISSQVPRLGGQPPDYLFRSLSAYRDDTRQSGIMEPVASPLTPTQMKELATYYAQLRSPQHLEPPLPADSIQRGRMLANAEASDNSVPACVACHTEPSREAFPMLAGQSAEYIRLQLRLFQRGGRREGAYAALMTEVASRLSPQQIEDVAAYFQSLPPAGSAQEVLP